MPRRKKALEEEAGAGLESTESASTEETPVEVTEEKPTGKYSVYDKNSEYVRTYEEKAKAEMYAAKIGGKVVIE